MPDYSELIVPISILVMAVGLIAWLLPQLGSALKRIRACGTMQERSEQILDRSEADQRRAAEILSRQEALLLRAEKLVEKLESKLSN